VKSRIEQLERALTRRAGSAMVLSVPPAVKLASVMATSLVTESAMPSISFFLTTPFPSFSLPGLVFSLESASFS